MEALYYYLDTNCVHDAILLFNGICKCLKILLEQLFHSFL